jgi:hypothetical protein
VAVAALSVALVATVFIALAIRRQSGVVPGAS